MALRLPPDDLTPEQLYLGSLKLIEEVIRYAFRGSFLRAEEAPDFSQWVHMKLIEGDYGTFRKFKGNCTLRTYLTTVIVNLARDYRISLWGKRRPSAAAERLGPVAVRLEELLRAGFPFEQACEILRTNEKVTETVEELEAIRVQLPLWIPRKEVGEEPLLHLPDSELPPDEQFEEREKAQKRRRTIAALYRACQTLPKEDRLFLKLLEDFSIAEIARLQKVDQKPLYRRHGKILKALRKALEREGVRKADIDDILN